jgi:hypothetical protein
MIRELDVVVLAEDMDEHGLRLGDAGSVVHSFTNVFLRALRLPSGMHYPIPPGCYS